MPGVTNFLTVNPPQTNCETDAAYEADSINASGLGANALVPGVWLNKFCHQVSVFCAAFTQMLAAKNITTNDADQNALATALAAVLTTSDVPSPLIAVPYSPAIVLNAEFAVGFQFILSGDVLASIAGTQPGQTLTFVVVQDAAGGHNFSFPQIIGFPSVSLDPNAITIGQAFVMLNGSIHPLPSIS